MLATQNNDKASAFLKSEKQVNTDKELAKIADVSADTIWKARVVNNEGTDRGNRLEKVSQNSVGPLEPIVTQRELVRQEGRFLRNLINR